MRVCLLFLLLSLPFLSAFVKESSRNVFKIAIIGGGVGGTSAAYFLNELIENKTNGAFKYKIDIFEKSSKIGGRLATVKMGEDEFEAGGSVIHPRNKYACDLVEKFGLKKRSRPKGNNDKICISNGRKFVFCESSWTFMNYFKLLYNYGFDIYHMEKYVSDVLDQFERIYKLQEEEYAFDQAESLLRAMSPSFPNLTEIALHEKLLKQKNLSQRFVYEIVQAVSLVNYGQTVKIPSFVGLVSFAGSGDLWSIENGNKMLPQKLLLNSNANIRLNTVVTSIVLQKDRLFQVHWASADKVGYEVYDYVILAHPQVRGDSVNFVNFTKSDILKTIFSNYQMHQTVATFVKGIPTKTYQNLSILSCDIRDSQKESGSFFTSLSQLDPVNPDAVDGPSGVYKIFSNYPLQPHSLYTLFDDIEHMEQIVWKAYPEYTCCKSLPHFRLWPGVYYLNSIEWAASAIEMSLIGGKNTALLVCRDLGLCKSKVFSEHSELKPNLTKVEL